MKLKGTICFLVPGLYAKDGMTGDIEPCHCSVSHPFKGSRRVQKRELFLFLSPMMSDMFPDVIVTQPWHL